MIKTVKISNFKSVQDLEIDLGRLNVFIGENGCGKTSILEGIAMGSAAAQDKLDNEFLVSRGVRVTDTVLMRSAFNNTGNKKNIEIGFSTNKIENADFRIGLDDTNKHWISEADSLTVDEYVSYKAKAEDNYLLSKAMLDNIIAELASYKSDNSKWIEAREKVLALMRSTKNSLEEVEMFRPIVVALENFLLYAPENYFLRRFEEEGQIRPLGIRGEGLFSHLVELSKETPETFAAIADNLSLIDWYGGFSIPNDLQFTERRIAITDRFISDTIKNFDQRSANEGFLYLLFYFTLFLSKWTPKFFAIDNVDNALNPRLCAKLIEILARLAKEQDKQAILTTHNPAILDGLDLTDDDQRLFVIYRNADGATQARRVKPLQALPGVEPVRLSEAFVRGYLGGLPKNF